VPDDESICGDQDPGPEIGPAADLAENDPGPIEVDAVMKNIVPPVHDPMADRDLHLGTAVDDDADNAR
jgi:hypothetical protein